MKHHITAFKPAIVNRTIELPGATRRTTIVHRPRSALGPVRSRRVVCRAVSCPRPETARVLRLSIIRVVSWPS